MAARWNQAQDRSLRHWRRVLGGIGSRGPMAIVSEINELGALCEMAGERAGGEMDRCRHCIVFRDASQCADSRLDISAFVLNGETDKARAATRAVVRRIAAACPPEYR